MQDRSWMLSADAIRAAKQCITVVKTEAGIKLMLSNPDFLQLLHQHVESTNNKELHDAYAHLLSFAGPGSTLKQLKPGKLAADHHDELKEAPSADGKTA